MPIPGLLDEMPPVPNSELVPRAGLPTPPGPPEKWAGADMLEASLRAGETGAGPAGPLRETTTSMLVRGRRNPTLARRLPKLLVLPPPAPPPRLAVMLGPKSGVDGTEPSSAAALLPCGGVPGY